MGREIKRVALDFDWPIGHVWPGYMRTICSEEITYCTKAEYSAGGESKDENPCCRDCRRFATLAGLPIQSFGCPDSAIRPPTGDGWQLWETVSEGSPISPVFATADELVNFMSQPAGDGRDGWAKGYDRAVAESWVKEHGWAPSMIVSDGRVMSGIEGVVEAQKGKEP